MPSLENPVSDSEESVRPEKWRCIGKGDLKAECWPSRDGDGWPELAALTLGDASSWLGSGVGSSGLEYIGSGVESSERMFSGSGDGASDLATTSGLESSDLLPGEPGNSMMWLCGRMALGPKYPMPSISDSGVIGFSLGATVTAVVLLHSTSGSSEESCFCISSISGMTLGSS